MKEKVRIRKLKNGKYEVCYNDPFKNKRIRKRANTYDEAKKISVQASRMFKNTKREHLQLLTVSELMNTHLEHSLKTKVDERRIPFESFMKNFGDIQIRNLSPTNLIEWMDDLKVQRDYAEITMGHIKGNLNHFFNFLISEGIIERSPLDFYKIDQSAPPKNERIFYTEDEIKLILDYAKEYSPNFLYPYLMGLVHTGGRRMELVNLTWKDVDLTKNLLLLTDVKNGSKRPIKMSPSLLKLVTKKDRISKYVFTNPEGEIIGRSQLHRHLKSFEYSYQFSKPIQCHAFRHSFAYNFLKKGGQMYELMAILGHKSISLTINLYGQLRSEDIDEPSPYSF